MDNQNYWNGKERRKQNKELASENARLREELAAAQEDAQVAQGQFRWASKQLAAAQATIEQMREALGNLLCRAETEYQALTDGEHGNFFEFPEAKFATATYHTTNLDALHEALAAAIENVGKIYAQKAQAVADTTLRHAYYAGRDVFEAEAAAHRARKEKAE